MNKYLYLISYLFLLIILYFGIGKINYLTFIIPLIICVLLFLLFEILHLFIKNKREKKLKELISKKFGKVSENSNGNLLFEFQNELIMLEYYCDKILGTFLHNSLVLLLDISEIDSKLLKLCKIHFETKEINGKVWIKKQFKPLKKRTVKYLVKNSEKEIEKLIKDYKKYIVLKR